MNFLFAIVIGAVIGAAGAYFLRNKQANAIWLAPV
jgi:gas vesicle protein